jgi:hypothetical protein
VGVQEFDAHENGSPDVCVQCRNQRGCGRSSAFAASWRNRFAQSVNHGLKDAGALESNPDFEVLKPDPEFQEAGF